MYRIMQNFDGEILMDWLHSEVLQGNIDGYSLLENLYLLKY